MTTRIARTAGTALALAALVASGCRPAGDEARDERRLTTRQLARDASDGAVQTLALLVADADDTVAVEAAFGLGLTHSPEAPGLLIANLPDDAPMDVVEAAAMGLGHCRTDHAGPAIVQLCLRPDPPRNGLEALFSHYRGPGRTPPKALPDAGLLRYADEALTPRHRAGIGWVARSVKDPRMMDPLSRLVADADPEVRRAAALGLALGSGDAKWGEGDAARAVAMLAPLLGDPDPRVVVAACRGLSTYDDPAVVPGLRAVLAHADFNARAAAVRAIAGVHRRAAAAKEGAPNPAADAADDLERLANGDSSVSVRYEAATALAAIDAARAQGLVDALLAADAEYLRAAGCAILGKAGSPEASPGALARLAELARDDPHVRVRWSALDAMRGKAGPSVVGALRHALEKEQDPVVVATACDVAAENRLEEFRESVGGVPGRFPGMDGADAREGAIGALLTYATPPASEGEGEDPPPPLPTEAERALIDGLAADAHPAVAFTAAKALAKIDGNDEPEPVRTAAYVGAADDMDGEGDVLFVVTEKGTMVIELDRDQAPLHCAHVTALARRGFYDGLTWHRVVPDFVIQGGCPRGDGAGAAGVALRREPTRIPYERGTLGMPRSSHPDSGGCQLFVMHSRAPHLDVQYTAFGRVVAGLDVVDRLDVDDRITEVRVETR